MNFYEILENNRIIFLIIPFVPVKELDRSPGTTPSPTPHGLYFVLLYVEDLEFSSESDPIATDQLRLSNASGFYLRAIASPVNLREIARNSELRLETLDQL